MQIETLRIKNQLFMHDDHNSNRIAVFIVSYYSYGVR